MISFNAIVPVRIHPIFWGLALLLGWLNSESIPGTMIWAVVIFISVLFHEYGHALTALAFGQTAEISLMGFGGVTQRHGPKLKLWQEFLIVLAGPLAGFLLCLLVFAVRMYIQPGVSEYLIYGLTIAIYINLFWTVVNLLPVLPLDGGHLMRIVMEGIFGFKGYRIAMFLSMLAAIAIGILFFIVQFMIAGALFLMFAFECYRNWSNAKVMTENDRDSDLQDLLGDAEKALEEGDLNTALQQLQTVRSKTQKGLIYQEATEDIAKILTRQGHFKEAYDILLPIEKTLGADMIPLMHQLAFRVRDLPTVVRLADVTYQEAPTIETAVMNSMAYAVLLKATPAAGWLQCAVNLGLENIDSILLRPEFDLVRNTQEFEKFR